MEKTKHYPNDVYKRSPSGRYFRIGSEFNGFPKDGIWLVQDGKSSMSCLIGSKERVPVFALNYRVHEQDLCKAIQDSMKKGGMSLMDESRLCCDFFARIAEREKLDAKNV